MTHTSQQLLVAAAVHADTCRCCVIRLHCCVSVSLLSVPGLPTSSTLDGRLGSVSSVIGVSSGCMCVLWCGLTGRQWSLYRLRGVLSSDLFAAGSFGRRALPASRGVEYANESEKKALQALGDQYGCHHCGRHIATHAQRRQAMLLQRSDAQSSNPEHVLQPYKPLASRINGGNRNAPSASSAARSSPDMPPAVIGFIGDHIPPSGLHRSTWLGRPVDQLFFPQCQICSAKQSQAVRFKRRTLIMPHWRRFAWSDLYPPPLFLMLYCVPALTHIHQQAHILAM